MSVGAIAEGPNKLPTPGPAPGKVGTLLGPRPARALGTGPLEDVGLETGATPVGAFCTGPRDDAGPPPGEVGIGQLSMPSGRPPDEVALVTLVATLLTVPAGPIRKLFMVGPCTPASTVAVAGAADWD
jgi:hypothetical protein